MKFKTTFLFGFSLILFVNLAVASEPNLFIEHINYQNLQRSKNAADATELLEYYKNLVIKNPADNMLSYLLARIDNDLENKHKVYQDLIENFALEPWGYYGLGQLEFDNTNFGKAQKLFTDAIQLKPEHFIFFLDLSRSYAQDYKLTDALLTIQQGLEIFPENQWLKLAEVKYLYNMQQNNKALKKMNNIINLVNIKSEIQAEALELLARINIEEKNITTALIVLTRLIELTPNAHSAWFLSASAQLIQKNFSLALQDCLQAIKLAPQHGASHYLIAALYKEKKWPVHQLWHLQMALKFDPINFLAAAAMQEQKSILQRLSQNVYQIEVELPAEEIISIQDLSNEETKYFI